MNSSKVIVFDLGKVLVDFDYSIAARKVAARSTKSLLNLVYLLSNSSLIVEYECGQVTRQQFFEQVRDAVGFQGDLAEFGGYFADIFTEIPQMIALHAELRGRGFKTYIFSNTNDLAIEHVGRNFPFFKNFDGYIYSCEVGAMKAWRAAGSQFCTKRPDKRAPVWRKFFKACATGKRQHCLKWAR